MANVRLVGTVLTGAGVAVVGATVEVLDRDTTTPVRATFTGGTDVNGDWNFSYAPGANSRRVDVRITNGTSISFLKQDDEIQVASVETEALRILNPNFDFEYDIVPAAITASRQLNLPLITATDTLVVLALAQTLTNKTLTAPVMTGLVDVTSGIVELNDALRFDTGVAIVAAAYALGRDADVTNQLHLNVPTGASFELSVNDVAEYIFTAATFNINGNTITNTGVLTLPTATDTLVGRDTTDTLTNKTLTTPTITATGWANANHAHAAANSGGTLAASAVVREGGNTTEATTTSTTAVDLLTASTLTLAALQPGYAVSVIRKTTGAATNASAGLKLNTAAVRAAAGWSGSTNASEQGGWFQFLAARLASYDLSTGFQALSSVAGLSQSVHDSAVAPTVEITDVIVIALVGSASITMGSDELHVYSYATS